MINSVNYKADFTHIFEIWYNMPMLFFVQRDMSRNLMNEIKIKSIMKYEFNSIKI